MTTALLATASRADTSRFARRALRGRASLLAGATALMIAATGVGLAIPLVLAAITDAVLGNDSVGAIDRWLAVLGCLLIGQAALSALADLLVARLGETSLAELREQVVDRALNVHLADIEASGTGDLLARVGDDVDAVSNAVRGAIPALVSCTLTIALTVVGLAALDWRLALAAFAATPIHIVATRWYLRRSPPLYAAERVANSQRAQQITETVHGADTVRAYQLTRQHRDLVERSSQRSLTLSLRAARTGTIFQAALNTAELVGMLAVVLAGFFAVRSGIVTVGRAAAAAIYFHGLFDPIGGLLGLLDTAQDAGAALARLVGVAELALPPEPTSPRRPADGTVELAGVTFGYGADDPVVRHLEISVADGESVALVGTSGAGKSTIAKLIAGIHTAAHGTVRLGGATHHELGRKNSRAAVALVTQEVHVFSGSLRDDLRLARPAADDRQLSAAMTLVAADDWLARLPDGLDTPVGEGGHALTPTQAQQVALARVILADTPVVVLDEATAESGTASARLLDVAAHRATADRTAIVVAHRLTQAAQCDRILVIDHGAVVESGTHDQLLDTGGAYANLWNAWSTHRPRSPAG